MEVGRPRTFISTFYSKRLRWHALGGALTIEIGPLVATPVAPASLFPSCVGLYAAGLHLESTTSAIGKENQFDSICVAKMKRD